MSIKQQFKFFFTTYHSGTFNILMHIISLTLHFKLAWPGKSIPLIILAFAIEEVGHWYDYFFRFKKDNQKKSIKILPFKVICVIIFCIIMALVYNWF